MSSRPLPLPASPLHWIVPVSLLLSACAGQADEDQDGYQVREGDCDDQDATVHPNAAELCDGQDQDCNGLIDEAASTQDADGDGFFTVLTSDCAAPDYRDARQGDCDDANSTTYPAAPDTEGDGIDSDCGGHDEADPNVGFEGQLSLEQALNNAKDGTTIWLAPQRHGFPAWEVQGKKLQLRGVAAPEETVLAGTQSTGLQVLGSATNATDENVTLTSLSLSDLTVTSSSASITAAIEVEGASLSLERVSLVDSLGLDGGAIRLKNARANLQEVLFEGNVSTARGGALYGLNSEVSLTDVQLRYNQALGETLAEGGALALEGGRLIAQRITLTENSALEAGGAISLRAVDAQLRQVVLHANHAGAEGGGLRVLDPVSFVLDQATVVANAGRSGGGVALSLTDGATSTERFKISNSVLAYNASENLHLAAPAETLKLTWSNLFVVGGDSTNLEVLPENITVAEPGFVYYTNNGDSADDVLLPRPGSVLYNGGDPLLLDSDNTRADIGAFGGDGADRRFYQDVDRDNLFDGWELLFATDLNALKSNQDSDGDGASNLDELRAGTLPLIADSDEDEVSDGIELDASSDPNDWYSRPGEAYPVKVSVSPLNEALARAIARIQYRGHVVLDAGTYQGPFLVFNQDLTLEGSGDAGQVTLLGGSGGLFTATQSRINLSGVTFSNGKSAQGGALELLNVNASLENVRFLNNQVEDPSGAGGGALYQENGELTIKDAHFEGQRSASEGGAALLRGVEGTLERVIFQQNRSEGGGGALKLEAGQLLLKDCTFDGNSAGGDGGAVLATDAALELRDVQILGGSAGTDAAGGGLALFNGTLQSRNLLLSSLSAGQGGALYASGTQGELLNTWVQRVSADGNGGGLYVENKAALSLVNALVLEGEASGAGGGLWVSCADLSLQNVTLVRGLAMLGGGAYVASSPLPSCPSVTLRVNNTIMAYNDVYNLYTDEPRLVSTLYSDYWNPEGHENTNIPSLVATNLSVEPGFLGYGDDLLPTDFHLLLGSPLLDQGSPSLPDADATRSDPGAYGGAQGGGFDRDRDGFGEYFWPGGYALPPENVNPYRYDCYDEDATKQVCG